MIDHDKCIGELLDFLDELGIADNTFVQYSTDNGPHMNTWPDAGNKLQHRPGHRENGGSVESRLADQV